MTGLPKTVILTPEEIRYAIEDVVSSIVASVIRCLAKAPPELSQDFLVRGMYLVGGGGLLRGLASRIERETKVPVRMSNVPLEAVVLGAGHVIEHYDALKGMFMGVAPLTAMRLDDRGGGGDGRRARPDPSRARDPRRLPGRGDAAAERAVATVRSATEHVDRTDRRVRDARPGHVDRPRPGVRDRAAGDDIVLHYAIADVGWFVRPGRPARRRGVRTAASPCTCPTGDPRCTRPRCRRVRRACCPTSIARRWCSRSASTSDGASRLDGVERAIVRSRAKLAYETVTRGRPARRASPSCTARIERCRSGADAARVDVPRAGDRSATRRRLTTLRFRPRLAVRGAERGAVAGDQPRRRRCAARRADRPVPGDARGRRATRLRRLRHTAQAFGLDWPHGRVARRRS